MAGERDYLTFFVDTDHTDDDQNIDALMTGQKWDTTISNVITFSFIDSALDLSYNPGTGISFSGAFNATQMQAARDALAMFASVSDVVFSELAFGSADGTLRFGEFSGIGTAYGYYPWSGESGGDMAFNPTDYNSPTLGSYAFATVLHEIGHAMGLKHGHEHTAGGGFPDYGDMDEDKDGMEYSVMTYNSFIGQNNAPFFYTNASGHYAQTLMMYDIAALQRMYGANWNENDSDTTYTFSTSTGEMMINGVGQGDPDANVIFRTIWDGDGVDTYDFSNFTTKLDIDLTPGAYSDLDRDGNAQRAQLNAGWDSSGNYVGASEFEWASGHVYNALQHEGSLQSLIENAKGGSNNDIITGNQIANKLLGFDGNDKIYGGDGNDDLRGGLGKDKIQGNKGKDVILGGSGKDNLKGQKGHDTIKGQDGADTIEGGAGNDELWGGKGLDVFVFQGDDPTGTDTIKDFQNGTDLIEISGSTVYADLTISNVSGDKHISWDSNLIVLEGIIGSVNADDFNFV